MSDKLPDYDRQQIIKLLALIGTAIGLEDFWMSLGTDSRLGVFCPNRIKGYAGSGRVGRINGGNLLGAGQYLAGRQTNTGQQAEPLIC